MCVCSLADWSVSLMLFIVFIMLFVMLLVVMFVIVMLVMIMVIFICQENAWLGVMCRLAES